MLGHQFHQKGYEIIDTLVQEDFLDDIVQTTKIPFENQMFSLKCKSMEELFKKHNDVFMNCAKHAQWNIQLHLLGSQLGFRVTNYMDAAPLVYICTRPVVYFNNLKTSKQKINHTMPAHVDSASMQGSSDSVVLWVPLISMTEDHGYLEVVPGSHKMNPEISKLKDGFGTVDESLYDFEPIKVPKGSGLVFKSKLIHRSGNLKDNKVTRWSAHFRYNNMNNEKFIENKYPHPYEYRNIPV
tara:strand:- start:434 stop:1153 length:720 start_codon:yes stop_codon:yes gene_type:complete